MDDVEIGDGAMEVDRELRRALAVAPSSEFVARVRTKIFEAPRPAMMSGALKYAAAIACVAAVAIAMGVREQPLVMAGLKPGTTYGAPSTTIVTMSTAYRPLSSPPVQLLTTGTAAAVTSIKAPTVAVNEPLPKVVIVPENAATVVQIMRNASELVVSFDERAPANPWAMNDLTVAPITIEPLESALARNN